MLFAKIGQQVFIGVLCDCVFWQLTGDSYNNVMNMASTFYFFMMANLMSSLASSIFIFQVERPLFLREVAEDMYSVEAYFVAKLVVDIPILLLVPFIFTLVVYFAIGY